MEKLLPYRAKSKKLLPSELLQMYRSRSGLTQVEVAKLVGLKSGRMVQSWEGGYSLPKADRLKSLIEVYLEKEVFVQGQEREEVQELWSSVKGLFEANSEKLEQYSVFDTRWFDELLSLYQSSIKSGIVTNKSNDKGKANREIPSQKVLVVEGKVPVAPFRLIGREQEVAALQQLLLADKSRLITLSGPGEWVKLVWPLRLFDW